MSFLQEQTIRTSIGDVKYYVGGSGAPLLYLHSGDGVHETHGLELLASAFRIFLPVMPGFDETAAHPSMSTVESLADFASEFIDLAIGAQCDVIGQAFGGWIAAWLAVKHPGKIGQLVLVAPSGFDQAGARPATDAQDSSDGWLVHIERAPEPKPAPIRKGNEDTLRMYQEQGQFDSRLVARLGEIVPLTLVILGTSDGVVAPASAQLLRATVPHSFFIYIYDAAHLVDIDQPERFARVIADFLRRGIVFLVNQGEVKLGSDQASI